MKESVTIAKEADAKKDFSSTKSDKSIHRVRDEPERQLGSLRSVIEYISRDGGTPSVDSIATELSSTHSAQRAPALLALQRMHGNRYVQRVVAGIQAKLKVGQPGDIYEQEAYRVAEEVMRMPEPQVQRQQEEEEEKKKEEEIFRTKEVSGQTPEVIPESHISVLRSGGQPLPESARAFFKPRFGYDFSQVRIHIDAQAAESARAVNAHAFTVGRDVVFGAGQYAPETMVGKRLLAHELAHVVQQGHSGSMPDRSLPIGQADDAHEIEANQAADFVTTSSDWIPIGFTPAQQSMQRACGPVEIGRVGGCIGFTGDVTGESFLFVVNCDNFRPDEQASLRAFAATVASNDILEIHGFASEEGPAVFNDSLSCARTHKAQSVLTSAGVSIAQIRTLYKHGATPGPRADRRSVVISKHPSLTPTPTPTPPAVSAPTLPSPREAAIQHLAAETLEERIAIQHPAAETLEERISRIILTTPPPAQPPRQSFNERFWGWVDEGLDQVLNRLPEPVRDPIRRGVHAAIERGAESILNAVLDSTEMSDEYKEAIRHIFRAARETPIY